MKITLTTDSRPNSLSPKCAMRERSNPDGHAPRLPLLAQSGHPDTLNQFPLSGVKRTPAKLRTREQTDRETPVQRNRGAPIVDANRRACAWSTDRFQAAIRASASAST